MYLFLINNKLIFLYSYPVTLTMLRVRCYGLVRVPVVVSACLPCLTPHTRVTLRDKCTA